MSGSNEAPKAELPDDDDIQKQRWFYACRLSKSQAEDMLCNEQSNGKQVCTSKFLVSNLSSSKDYRISIKKTGQAVEHIIISYNEEDQSYGIEGQNSCQSVVEVVRNYVTSCGHALEPFSGSFTIISTAKVERSSQENKSSSIPSLDETERGWCCEGCDSLCDALGYKNAGWVRRIYSTILFIFCGCCLFTVCITLEPCSDKGIYDKCCDCCPRCCGCEEFCEEYNSCCDED